MPIQKLIPGDFNDARQIDWFSPGDQPGNPAQLGPGAYGDPAGARTVTLLRAAPTQALTVNICGPLGLPCNLMAGMGLLLGTNVTSAPLRMTWSQGVASVGAFVVAQAASGLPYTAVLWVRLAGDQQWHSVQQQGVTGPVWTTLGDTVAPFVGARAPAGSVIDAVLFDAVHPGTDPFSPLGIGPLYFREA